MKHRTKARVTGLMSLAAMAVGMLRADASTIAVTNSISADTTWTSNNVYTLDRLITVQSGATLTIQAGTVIRGLPVASVPSQPGSLMVCRGAMINAQGTAANPIVFTDEFDDNLGGTTGGIHTNRNGIAIDYSKLNNQLTGEWGGVILCGKSYIGWDSLDGTGVYSPDGRVTAVVEGITSGSEDTSYGGNDDYDNSGTLNYISIRYSGFILGPSKEINALTFCGVGRNTSVDHIDCYAAKDDNIECFGGCVNLKHLCFWNGCDDGLDTDTGWRGKVQFMLNVQGMCTNSDIAHSQLPDSSDKGLEWDGAGDSTGFNDDPQSCGTMFNFTMIGLGSNCLDYGNNAFTIRDNAGGRLYNGLIMDFGGGCSLIEGVTNGTWAYGANCSAMKLFEDYTQDVYYITGTNKQGVVLTNYMGYPYPITWATSNSTTAGGASKLTEMKRLVYWNMGIPHSIGLTNAHPTADGKLYVGNDNSRFSTHAHVGTYPDNTGWDIVAPGNAGGNLNYGNGALPAPNYTPINYYERETNARTFQPTFRASPYTYTCVKLIDPRANTNYWSSTNYNAYMSTYGVKPPADGFYTPVQFVGAMGKKNWAGPWSTAWRLGGFKTNSVTTGDETGIVPTISTNGGLKATLSVDTYAGIQADWWLVGVKGASFYYYKSASNRWFSGVAPATQGALSNLPQTTVPTNGLPSGTYTMYLGADLKKDGQISYDSLYVTSSSYVR